LFIQLIVMVFFSYGSAVDQLRSLAGEDGEEWEEEFEEELEEEDSEDEVIEVPKKLYLAPVLLKPSECSICLEEFEDLHSFSCGHYFCKSCIQEYVKHQIRQLRIQTVSVSSLKKIKPRVAFLETKHTFGVLCPSRGCKNHISQEKLAPICTFLDKLCRVCLKLSTKVVKDKLFCENCLINICGSCRRNHPDNISCDVYFAWWIENSQTEDKVKYWCSTNPLVKKCPKCSSVIEKNGGCTHMFCQNCNTAFDWEKDAKRFAFTTRIFGSPAIPKIPSRKWRRKQRIRRRGAIESLKQI